MSSEIVARAARARAWCRADLAGGTLDIWPLGILHPGARTVNLALDLAVEVAIEPAEADYCIRQGDGQVTAPSLPELAESGEGALLAHIAMSLGLPPFRAEIRSASPRGGGLGASSALAVAAIAAGEAMMGLQPSSPEHRSALARDLEARLMQLPTGRQDHYPALLGGVLEISHRAGGERVRQLEVDVEALGGHLIIAYTGQSHFSAGNNWMVVRRRLERDPEVVELFDGICEIAKEIVEALESGELETVGRLVSREWALRRRLSEEKSTPMIETILERAVAAGAWGGKACGAGGGGCVVLLCPAELREAVQAEVAAVGADVLAARPVASPLEVVQLERP